MRSILISAALLLASFAAAQTSTRAPTATGTSSASDPCETIDALLTVCSTLNGPDFDDASAYDQASCLCFESDGSFNPDIWDEASVACVNGGSDQDIIAALKANNNLGVNLCSKYADAVASETATATGSARATGVASETFTNGGARTTNLPSATGTSMVLGGARTRTSTGSDNAGTATAAATSSSRTAAPTKNAAANVKVGGAALLVGLGLAIVA